MPRPLLRTPKQEQKTQADSLLSTSFNQEQQKQQNQQIDQMKLNRLLRKRRSKEYMDAIHKLDAGGHVHNQHQVKEIIDAINEEFPEVSLSGMLLGVVSKCYLGDPYEVHSLDMTGFIIMHYKRGEVMENGLEKARSIAMRGGYDCIEVYTDCCRAVASDGSIAVITG